MKKILLSKKEAAALESAIDMVKGDIAHIVQWHTQDLWSGDQEALNQMDLDAICTALYVGYEVEAGTEEKVLDYYQSNTDVAPVIEDILNLLEIYIPGIN